MSISVKTKKVYFFILFYFIFLLSVELIPHKVIGGDNTQNTENYETQHIGNDQNNDSSCSFLGEIPLKDYYKIEDAFLNREIGSLKKLSDLISENDPKSQRYSFYDYLLYVTGLLAQDLGERSLAIELYNRYIERRSSDLSFQVPPDNIFTHAKSLEKEYDTVIADIRNEVSKLQEKIWKKWRW